MAWNGDRNLEVGMLVRFYDTFNSHKNVETLGVVVGIEEHPNTWSHEKMKMYSVLLADGRSMNVYEYELREVGA